MSKNHAITIIGHCSKHKGGETVQIEKMSQLLNVEHIEDVIDLFEGRYNSIASLNYALAEAGHPLLDDIYKLPHFPSKNLLLLSFSQSLAALVATGAHKKHRLLSKFYVHHRNEKVFPMLYQNVDLLITESLLANIRGAAYGIPESKMLYFPHYYPPEAEKYEKAVTEEVTIGVVSRFERGKNCEYALEVCRRIAERYPIKLILMGDFEKETTDPHYQEKFREMLECYTKANWFVWEKQKVPFSQVLEKYNRFDICLQLSGAEAGSNTIVELLGMGKPVIALNASTNPYLFKGGAYLVEADPEDRPGQLSYQVPNIDALEAATEALVREPKLRIEWRRKAQGLAKKRFHISEAQKRLDLLFCEDPAKLQERFNLDRQEYGF